jgi:hypothetical protein
MTTPFKDFTRFRITIIDDWNGNTAAAHWLWEATYRRRIRLEPRVPAEFDRADLLLLYGSDETPPFAEALLADELQSDAALLVEGMNAQRKWEPVSLWRWREINLVANSRAPKAGVGGLSDEDWQEAWRLYTEEGYTHELIARRFNVARETVTRKFKAMRKRVI